MNKIYRLIWNSALNTWVVASEIATGRTKQSGRKRKLMATAALALVAGGAAAQTISQGTGGAGSMTVGTSDIASGTNSAAIGINSTATGNDSIAIGDTAKATNLRAMAIGNLSVASGQEAVAYGYNATASGTNSTAISHFSTASGYDAVAIGPYSSASGQYSVAIGSGASASQTDTVAIGDHATSLGAGAIAIGQQSQAANGFATAVGYQALANQGGVAMGYTASAAGKDSLAIGTSASTNSGAEGSMALGRNSATGANATSAIAIGDGANATGNHAVSMGANASATGNSSVAIGASGYTDVTNSSGPVASGEYSYATGVKAKASAGNSIAIGQGAVADGPATANSPIAIGFGSHATDTGAAAIGMGSTASINASAFGQYSNATGVAATALGYGASATGMNSIALGSYSSASAEAGTALGSGSSASYYATAVGQGAKAGDNSTAVGQSSKATSIGAALGYGASSTGGYATAIGAYSSASGQGSVVLGGDYGGSAQASGYRAMALGAASSATQDYAIAEGSGAVASSVNAIALGRGANASAANSVALGASSTTTADLTKPAYNPSKTATVAGTAPVGEVSVGSAGKERRITNLAAGSAATDAVNVSQLQAAQTHYYSVNDNGTQGANYNNDGATGIGSLAAGTNAIASGDHSTAVGDGAKASASSSVAIGFGAVADGPAAAASLVAIGTNAHATNTGATAVGLGSTAGFNDSAFGQNSNATGGSSAALGYSASATGGFSTAVGPSANASGQNAVAVGSNTSAGYYGSAIGGSANAGMNSSAIGDSSMADGVSAALGHAASATGGYSTALGPTANASGSDSLAAGVHATASNSDATAIGAYSTASGDQAIAAGYKANASAPWSAAFGANASATAADSVAIGSVSSASGKAAVALGDLANATADNSVALGARSTTTANLSAAAYNPGTGTLAGTSPVGEVSVGSAGAERRITNLAAGSAATDAVNVSQLQAAQTHYYSVNDTGTPTGNYNNDGATGIGALAAGTNAIASGDHSTAVGDGAKASSSSAIAIGNGAVADGPVLVDSAIAIGTNAHANNTGATAVGLGSTAGFNDSAFGQNSNATGNSSVALGNRASATGYMSTAVGPYSSASSEGAVAVGNGSSGGYYGTAVGAGANAGMNSSAIGDGSMANGVSAALGHGASASGGYSSALGPQTTASGSDSLAAGLLAKASNTDATALGSNSTASGEQAIAAGYKANASAYQSAAFGAGASATAIDSVALGANSTTTADLTAAAYNPGTATLAGTTPVGEVSVGSAGAERRITNLAAGSAGTDAVNVSQLQSAMASGQTHYYSVNDNGTQGANYNNNGATGVNALAAGVNAKASSDGTVALGSNVTAGSATYDPLVSGMIAIGSKVSATAKGAIAVGTGNTIATGDMSIAMGTGTQATQDNAIAIGQTSSATAQGTIAFGQQAQASSNYGVAIGYMTRAQADAGTAGDLGTGATAVGDRANASGTGAAAFGYETGAVGVGSTALGSYSAATNKYATAVGFMAKATGSSSSAVGDSSTASDYATAIGRSASATGNSSTAIGRSSSAAGVNAAAIGSGAQAVADQSLALGLSAKSSVKDGVALGSSSVAGVDKGVAGYVPAGVSPAQSSAVAATTSTLAAVSVGDASNGVFRQINGVAAGTVDSDAVNVAQLKAVDSKASAGWNLQANGGTASNVAPGGTVNVVNGNNINVTQNGNQLTIATADDVSFSSVTTGNTKLDTNGLTINGGPSVTTAGIDAGGKVISNVAPGVAGTDAVNVDQLTAVDTKVDNVTNTVNNFAGDQSTTNTTINGRGIRYVRTNDTGLPVSDAFAQGQGSTAVGYEAKSTGADALALGRNAQASADNSVALGANSTTTADLTTSAYNPGTGTIAGTSPVGEVSVGSAGAERRITNLAAGSADTDAVNVSQLKAVDGKVNNLDDRAVKYDVDPTTGAVNYNSVTLGGDTYNTTTKTGGTVIHNVAAGTSGGDAVNVDQLNQQGSDLTSKGLNFAGNSGTAVHTNLGDTLTIAGTATTAGTYSGNNLKTVTDPTTGAVNLQMADNPEFTSVKTGNTTINDSGLTINGGPSITTAGIDAGGKVISNVAPGVAGTDAVNVDQLTAVDTKVDNVTNTVNNFAGDQSTTNTTINGRGIRYVRTNDTGLPVSDAFAQGQGSTAVGYEAKSTGADALALGRNAQASADNSVALGANSTTTADLTTPAYNPGTGTIAGTSPVGEVSVGSAGAERRITNLAAGAADTDAVNVSQLKSATAASVADAVMYDNSTHNSVTLGGDTYNSTTKTGGTKITNVARGVNDSDAVNMSQLNETNQTVTNLGDTVNNFAGDQSTTNTTINGRGIRYVRTNDTGLPVSDAFAQGQGSTAVGYEAKSTGAEALALGRNAQASADNSVALGANSTTTADLTTQAYNPSSTATIAGTSPVGEVSVGSAGAERRITNLAAGAADTDAVNVSQLKAVDGKVNNLDDRAVKYDVDPTTGAVNYNSVTLGGDTYNTTTKTGGTVIHNVAAGTSGGDAVNVDQLNQQGSDLTSKGLNFAGNSGTAVHTNLGDTLTIAGTAATAGTYSGNNLKTVTDPATGAVNLQMADNPEFTSVKTGNTTINDSGLTINGGPSVTTAGIDAGGKVISNVAPGVAGTDAVNVDQLTAVDTKVDNVTNTVNNFAGDQSTSNTTINGRGIRYVRTNDAGLPVSDAFAQGQGSTAVGYEAKSTGADALALGRNAQASADNSVALGANSTTTADLTTSAYNPSSTATIAGTSPVGEVSVGSAGAERRITNLAAGSADTDAVNVSQLKAVDGKVNNLDDRAVKYDVDPTTGAVNYNSVTLGGDTYNTTTKQGGTVIHNVAAGTSGGDAVNVDQLNQQGSDLTSKGLNFAGNSGTAVHTNLGDTLTIAGTATTAGTYSGNNLKTVTDPATGAVQLQMADNPEFTSVKTGNTTINDSGLTINGGPSITTAGIDAGGRKIVNVAPGEVSATSTDAINGSQLNETNQTVTNLGDTVNNFAGDQSTTNTTINGRGIRYVRTNDTGLPVSDAFAQGQGSTAVGYEAKSTGADALALGRNAQASADNSVALGASSTTTADLTTPAYNPGTGTIAGTSPVGEVSVGSAGAERRITNLAAGAADTDAVNVSQLKSATAASVADAVMYDNSTHNSVTLGGDTYNSTTKTGGTVIHNVAAGTSGGDAVNVDQLNQQGSDLTAKGLNFAGNSGTAVHTNLGDTLTIAGTATTAGTYSGNNLKTVTDPTTGAVNLQMADNPEFTSVKTGNTTINDSGLTINGGPSVTTAGIDAGGKVITNVAPGVAGTDAVNVDQLTAVDTKVDNVTNTVNNFAGDQSTSNTTINGRGIRYVRTNDAGLPVSDAFAQGQGSTAVGYEAKSTGADALALGRNAQASADNSVALGANSTTTADLTTPAYNPGTGTIAGTSPVGEVSVGSAGAERRITNLAAGAADTDAVNVSQLKSATAASVADAVMYDNSTHNSVTLGGDTYNSTTKTGGTVIHNVAAGTSGGDAVNVDQLNQQGSDLTSKGLNFAGNSGTAVHTNLGDTLTIAGAATTAGTYSGNNLKTVTDPATGAVQLQMADAPKFGNVTINDNGSGKITGVTAGTAATDAVNVSQLTQVADSSVKYDKNTDGTVNYNSVTLGGDTYNTTTKTGGTVIHNVAAGTSGGDAVNVDQLNQQGSDLTSKGLNFAGNSGTAVHTNLGDTLTIAGAATTAGTYSGNNLKTVTDPATGAVNLQMADAPKFGNVTINDNGSGKITGVTAGTAATDAVNVSQLTQVADSSVKYDKNTDGTVNYNSVTLGGDTYNTTTKQGGTVIHNVAAGTSGGDAVNVDQLNQQGSDLTSKGLNFAGNSGTAVHTNLGDTLTIAGTATTGGTYSGNNLKTVTDPATGAVNLQMADAPKFGNVTINDNGSGKITGVTAGTAATDAVNVSQLTQVADSSVKYDKNTDGTTNYNSVTLGGDTYNSTTKTGGTKITNVAAGTNPSDAVNVDQLNQQGSDLTSKGLNFAGNSGTAVHTNLGDTLTIAGTATTAGTYSGNNLKTVTDPATGAVQLQMADAPKFGNVTINDNGSGKITGVTAGTAATDAVNVSQLTQVADSSVKYDKNTDGTVNYNSVTLGGDTYNTTTKTGGTVIHNVAAGTSGGDAVNVDQLNQQGSDLTSKGLNFAGNSGTAVHTNLGDTLTIAGAATTAGTYSGNNLKTVTDPATGAVQLQMADNPEFASVKTGNTTIDNNGVTIAGGPSITTAGIDAANTKITNVAAGTNATDAVNVSQLTQTVDASKTHYYSVNDNGVQGGNYANDGATGVNSLAAGVGAQATVAGGVALGSGSVANTAGGVAGWTPANASTASGTAITATTSTLGAVSVGDATNGQFRQITGVAAGTKDSDAVNVAQLKGVDAKVDNLDSNAVKYDDSTHNSVTLGGDTYNTITKTGGTRIKNVAAGVDGGDAVNVDQLNASKTHYYSVNDNGVQGGNYANDGATGVNSLAAGVGAKATADGGVALGSGSVASTAAGVAGFVPQSASTAQGAAIAATTSTLGAVSVGDAANGQFRQITGVAAGTADSDAVNVAQLKGVDQKVGDLDNSTVKYDKNTDGTVNYNSVTLGGDTYNSTTKTGGTVIHNVAAGTNGGDAVNVDQLNTTVDASKTHYYSVNDNGVPGANYANDGATGLNAMAMGVGASASTAGGVALGSGSVASTAGGIAGWVPTGADATLANAVMGTMGTAGAVSVGNPAAGIYRQITGVAAGTSASDAVNVAQLQAAISSVDGKITPDDGRNVKYDGTGNAPKDHVTLAGDTSTDGGKTGGTTISNVHQGDVSANSTDAVNGAQLYATNAKVDNLETTVNNWGDVINKTEGNTRYFQADGTNTDADKAYVQAGTKGVASGANASVTGNNGVAMGNTASASGNNSTAIGANTKATHDNSVALGAGSETDRANSVSVGTAGNERQITNVAAGTAATDAVNVSQLQSGLNDVQNAAINYTNQQVNNVRRDAYAGTASAMAMAALPQATLPGRGMVAMGGGTYGGQSAVALGLSKMSESGRWVFKAQATSNTRGNVGVAAGAGFHW